MQIFSADSDSLSRDNRGKLKIFANSLLFQENEAPTLSFIGNIDKIDMSDNSDVPLVWAISGNKDPGNGPKDHNRGPMQQHEGSMVNGMVENTSNTSNLVDNTANAQTRDNSAYEPSSVSTTEQFIDFRGSSAANESKSNRNRSDTRPVHKLFIGGVGYHTTDEDFRNYFLKFGPMTDCVVMREKGKFARPVHPHENLLADGESRGFGFVVFKHRDAMNACMDAKLELDGRPMDSKIAIPKGEGPEPRGRDREQRGRGPFRFGYFRELHLVLLRAC